MPPSSRVHRRDWLRGRTGRPGVAPASATVQPGATDLLRVRRPAMGTHFDIRVPVGTPGGLDLATSALDLIDELESQMTVYRDHSELSRINAMAGFAPVVAEEGLFRLLELARDIHDATGGAYDVTAGALSAAWGFFRGPKRVPSPEELAEVRDRTGQSHVTLDPEARSVRFDRPGVVLNLGSIGKGYALDRAAERIAAHWWPTAALLHGGQSSIYALGSPPWDFGGRWEVALRNPGDADRPLGKFRLRNRAMGTSGASFQQFEAGGRYYGHILDPRTGEPPADGPASVSVLAPTAAEADALSTAFYLLGPEKTAAVVRDRPDVGVLFVLKPAGDDRPRLVSIHLTAADFESEGRVRWLAPIVP